MTEAEWMECIDPRTMLDFLDAKADTRKLRLFACACARRIWNLLTDPRSRAGVETAELAADGLVSQAEHQAGWCAAHAVFMEAKGGKPVAPEAPNAPAATIAFAAYCASGGHVPSQAAEEAAEAVGYQAGGFGQPAWHAARNAEWVAQSHLLRDLFGNPFRPPVIEPGWLNWDGGDVSRLAQTIYEQRRFSDLPLLADALERAGCTDADILTHCRGGGQHARGCWVVDALLGRIWSVRAGLLSTADWNDCPDTEPLLACLRDQGSTRKWRLFAVACCRRIAQLITDPRSQAALEVAERLAEGLDNPEEVTEARAAAETAASEASSKAWFAEIVTLPDGSTSAGMTAEHSALCALRDACGAVFWAVSEDPRPSEGGGRGDHLHAIYAVSNSVEAAVREEGRPWEEEGAATYPAQEAERAYQASLLRDIFGPLSHLSTEPCWLAFHDGGQRWSLPPLPHRPRISESWLGWNDGIIPKLATAIYEQRAFDRLPILADALEEAGCADTDILNHCRQPGEHVRGCWVIDALLGKS